MSFDRMVMVATVLVGLGSMLGAAEVERVTTGVPFPRGLVMVDGDLMVLSRGRVRGAGGVTAAVEDRAGTLWVVNPGVSEPIGGEVGKAVRENARVLAEPTAPPFRLWDREAVPPESDRVTDRPYCTLRYHAASKNFFLCAFSGIDKPKVNGSVSFSKNLTDGLLRYDTRVGQWFEVERHNIEAGGSYPHHDPAYNSAPHGWLNGPDNCLVSGDWLLGVGKDNSVLVGYDLREIVKNPEAGAPASRLLLGERVRLKGSGETSLYGTSALAIRGKWLYVGYRTSSVIVRFALSDDGLPKMPMVGELVARFDPYDPKTGASANLTDMGFDEKGRLYVVSAKPSRVFRLTPDPKRVFDGRTGKEEPWADMAALTKNPKMKSENVLCDGGWCYVTSGDGYGYGVPGTVYRVKITD